MKKILIAFAAFAALVACQKVENVAPVAATGYSFNFDVNGASSFEGVATKAVKTGWEAGDKVFVFFKEGEAVLSDIYAEMTYDGAAWAAVQRGDGSLGEAGQLTAVYVPFADDSVKPEYAEGQWSIAGGDVYCTSAENVSYTVSANTVNATINMALPEGYVQFYMTGVDAGEILTCDKVDSYETFSIGNDMTVTAAKKGAGMTGRAYKEGTVFYGKYNGSAAPLTILTVTKTGSVYKMTKAKALEANKAYALGAFEESASTWTLCPDILPGVFSVSPSKQVRFSKANLYYDAAASKYAFEEDVYAPGCTPFAGIMGMLTPGHTSHFFWSSDASIAMTEPFSDPSATANDVLFVNENKQININGESWYNLTADEWKYLMKNRDQDTYFFGSVNGIACTIIVPDGFVWDESIYGEKPAITDENADYTKLVANADVAILPTNGMYLPAMGLPFVLLIGAETCIWTSSSDNNPLGAVAMAIAFDSEESGEVKCNILGEGRDMAAGIRLVTDPQYNPTAIK